MNARERFRATVRYEPRDRPFHWDWMGPEYDETVARWKREGMPPDSHWRNFGQYDRTEYAPAFAWILPQFEVEVLETDDEYETYRDADGVIKRKRRDAVLPAMPQYVEFPVKGREEWGEIRRRLDPSSPARFPPYWESIKHGYRDRDHVLCVRAGSLFGWLRNLMGLEGICLALCDDRAFIEQAVEEMADHFIAFLDLALDGVEYDFASFAEDLAYKTGSMIDPQLYRELFGPHYRRIVDRLHRAGIDTILIDSDGNVEEVIPIWLDLGINLVYPLEVAAGMDPIALRQRFGRDLIISGGVDKRILAGDKAEITRMVERLAPLVQEGGYIPCPDHCIPPDVPWENFLHYENLMSRIEA